MVRHSSTPLTDYVDRASLAKLIATIVLLLAAAAMVVSSLLSHRGDSDGKVYFYDLSQQKLFAAPRSSVPPIRGIDNEEQDGVRAIVISESGNPADRKHRRIAYLEKYTPQLKAQFETIQKEGAGGATSLRREEVPGSTLVRRLTDREWYPMNSAEGEKIVAEWNVPGPNGTYPAVCVP